MEHRIDRILYDNAEIQNYEVITDFNWEDIEFVSAPISSGVISALARLYRVNIISRAPHLYGTLVFFHVPDSITTLPFGDATEDGIMYDTQALVAYHGAKLVREKKIRIEDNQLLCEKEEYTAFFSKIQNNDFLLLEKGSASSITFMPISSKMGFLSDISQNKKLCNSHFFLMDITDRDSPYDVYGTPYGLALTNGIIQQPPLLQREAILVDKANNVLVSSPSITDCAVIIDNTEYRHKLNSVFYYRPDVRKTPKTQGSDIIIVNDTIVALKHGGESIVPMAGFAIQVPSKISLSNTCVHYSGFENYTFGIQIGSAMMQNGKMHDSFTSRFYAGDGTIFPPTVYPLQFETARAARMGIGNKSGKPIIIWAEGAGKNFYQKGIDSCGVSLLEFAKYCKSLGIENFVNMDGGGSSQFIVNGKRNLHIADRDLKTNEEAERPIPLGLSFT